MLNSIQTVDKMSQKLSIDEALEKIDYTFRWTGMNLQIKKKTVYENRKYLLFYIFNFLWLNTDVAGALCWFAEGIKRNESLTSLTYIAPCFTLSLLADFKSIFYIANRNHVNELITIIRQLEIRERTSPEVKKKKLIMKKDTEFLLLVLKALNFVNWTLLISFPLMPLTLMFIKYMNTNQVELLLPFLILYPFDPFDLRIWPFVYVRQIWSEVIVILDVCGVDYLFYVCSLHICMQFRLLQHDVTHMLVKPSTVGENDVELKDRFVELVRWHLMLIRSVQHLEAIYSKSTLFNIVFSSALICLTGFNVTTVDDTAFVISFLSFLFMSLLQIYFLCFFGDMLMRASAGVGDAVYNCNWYTADAKIAKQLLYMQLRAQKPCKLTALGYATVNLNAFMRILSTSWSYFTLLKSVYSSRRH